MLGFLKSINSDINGCLPDEPDCDNPINPQDTGSETVTVDDTAINVQVDPHHSISWTTAQIYGTNNDQLPATMDGFISAYADEFPDSPSKGNDIMKCFSPEHLPILTNLSLEYGVFDGWFASVPGPTMVNRAYAASATSNGMGTNDVEVIARGMPQKTMFKQMREMGLDYRVYFQDIPHVLMFDDMREPEALQKYRLLDSLYSDLEEGNLPEFVWIEPAYLNSDTQMSTDQHPDHDVSLGESLIRDIYEALRASVLWEDSALLITYDEHGGFFDHVPPPTGVPNPDGKNATDDPFDFTRIGVRVPAVLISPWVRRGSVYHAAWTPASAMSPGASADRSHHILHQHNAPSQYEHSSIISTAVHELFPPSAGYPSPEYLTKRDEWALSFGWVFDELDVVRTDCPEKLPAVYNATKTSQLPQQDGSAQLSDLQQELLALAAGVDGNITMVLEDKSSWTEREAAAYIKRVIENRVLFL